MTVKKKSNLEKSIKELEEIVAKIEQEDIPIDKLFEMHAKGMKMIDECKSILLTAENKIIKYEN